VLLALAVVCGAPRCLAWGDDGHRAVALIAEHYLSPATRQRVAATLATDIDLLPPAATDMAGASTWADAYRDSDRNGARLRYRQTLQWHFVNISTDRPDLRVACFGRPPLKPGQPASRGPGRACIVDKIEQFRAEWLAPDTDPRERVLALRFLIHLVGDLHQPLHASDRDDHGGNDVAITAPGMKDGSLHRFWDTRLVKRLAPSAAALAARLLSGTTADQRAQWQRGSVADWALEANALARAQVYAALPAPAMSSGQPVYRLDRKYVSAAEHAAALQLGRAGVRLATLLEPDDRQKLQFH
jgi:hypothetical protein